MSVPLNVHAATSETLTSTLRKYVGVPRPRPEYQGIRVQEPQHMKCKERTANEFADVCLTTVDYSFDSLFERSEFLIDTSQKKSLRVCLCARVHACSTNLGFSVRSANRIRPKHGIPLPV